MRNKKTEQLNPNYPAPRQFRLPHHHYLVGEATPGGLIPDPGVGHFRIMRGPDGRPVARRHGDLGEGEISYVLE